MSGTIKKITQSAQCVPKSPTAKCWKIRLTNEVSGYTLRQGIEFHVQVDGTFHKGTLNAQGESGLFSAEQVAHEHVYFALKLLPDYKSCRPHFTIYTDGASADAARDMIWSQEETDQLFKKDIYIANLCATRISYILNRSADCRYTYPRLLRNPELRANWTDNLPLSPHIKSHALPRGAFAGDSFNDKTGTIHPPGEHPAGTRRFNYITSVRMMMEYLLATYPDAPKKQWKEKDTTEREMPTDAAWVGCGLWPQGDGHSLIYGGAFDSLERYPRLVRLKFTQVEANGIELDVDRKTHIVWFKHTPVPPPSPPPDTESVFSPLLDNLYNMNWDHNFFPRWRLPSLGLDLSLPDLPDLPPPDGDPEDP